MGFGFIMEAEVSVKVDVVENFIHHVKVDIK